MIIQKEKFAFEKRDAARPSGQASPGGISFERDGDKHVIDENELTFAAYFVAGNAGDAFDDRPTRREEAMLRNPDRRRRARGNDGPIADFERAAVPQIEAFRRAFRAVPEEHSVRW